MINIVVTQSYTRKLVTRYKYKYSDKGKVFLQKKKEHTGKEEKNDREKKRKRYGVPLHKHRDRLGTLPRATGRWWLGTPDLHGAAAY